jgi:hypothetical protein
MQALTLSEVISRSIDYVKRALTSARRTTILGFGEPLGASLISPIFTRQTKQVTAPGSPGASTITLNVTDVRERH